MSDLLYARVRKVPHLEPANELRARLPPQTNPPPPPTPTCMHSSPLYHILNWATVNHRVHVFPFLQHQPSPTPCHFVKWTSLSAIQALSGRSSTTSIQVRVPTMGWRRGAHGEQLASADQVTAMETHFRISENRAKVRM